MFVFVWRFRRYGASQSSAGMSCYSMVENNTQRQSHSLAMPRMGFLLSHPQPLGARSCWLNVSKEDRINPVKSTSPSHGRRCWILLTRASSPCHLGAWSRTYLDCRFHPWASSPNTNDDPGSQWIVPSAALVQRQCNWHLVKPCSLVAH